MILSALEADLYRRLAYPASPHADVTTRLRAFLNARHRRLLTSPGLRQLREGFGTITSVASQAEYAVPYGISRLMAVRDLTNRRALQPMSIEAYRAREADPSVHTGTPDSYVPIGFRAVIRRPAGTGLWAVSSNVGDTTQVVYLSASLTAFTPRGVLQNSTNTLNGTTRVRLGTGPTDTFDDAFTISLSAATTGAISIFDAAASGNVIATIPAGRRNTEVFVIALSPTPASALDYAIDYEHALIDLANAWDEPKLPEDFHDLLVLGARMDEYEHRDDNRYGAAKAEYEDRIKELKAYLYNHRAALAPRQAPEIAPLGPWFPRQSY